MADGRGASAAQRRTATGRLASAVRRLRERPVLLLAGAGSALATLLALLVLGAWSLRVDEPTFRDGAVTLLAGLLVYDAVLVLTKPAVLPGLYAAVRDQSTTDASGVSRTLRVEARRHYLQTAEASLRARVAGIGYALVFAPVILGVVGVGATAASLLGYWSGLFGAPAPFGYVTALVALLLVVWLAGRWPVALAEPLAIEGASPIRAWRDSTALVWRRPRTAGRVAAQRLALGALPFAILFTAATLRPDASLADVALIAAAVGATGVVTKTVEGVVTAAGVDALGVERHLPAERGLTAVLPVDRVRPSARTALVVVLVVGLVLASGALRVTDVRPDAEPASPAAVGVEDPDEYYAVARDRTTSSSRAVTREAASGNWTAASLDRTLRLRIAIDYSQRAAAVEGWHGDDGTWVHGSRGYATDGLYASYGMRHAPIATLDTRRIGRWSVSATPEFPELVEGLPFQELPDDVDGWTVAARGNGTTVLEIDDPNAVARHVGTSDASIEYGNGSRIRVRIDEATQRIESVVVRERYVVFDAAAGGEDGAEVEDDAAVEAEADAVDRRVAVRTTLQYEYDDLEIERPDEIGRYPWGYVWDLVYY